MNTNFSAGLGPHPRKWPGIYFLMRASSKRAEQEMSLMVLLAIALTYRVIEKLIFSEVPNKHPWTDIIFLKKFRHGQALLGPGRLLNFDLLPCLSTF